MKNFFSERYVLNPKRNTKVTLYNYSRQLKLLFVLTCALFVANSFGQNKLWVVGDNLVNFNNSSAITTPALPQPSVPAPLQPFVYDGQIAINNQYAEYDQNGQLLFFIVDGNIYDKDGYMMVDSDDGTCTICFPDYSSNPMFQPVTTNSLVVTRVPGHCDKYYIAVSGHIAILDLNLPNSFFPGNPLRSGSLVPFGAIYDEQVVYPDIDFTSFFNQTIPNVVGDLVIAPYYVKLPYQEVAGHSVMGIYHDIYDDNISGNKFLGLATEGNLVQYELRNNGVFYANFNPVPNTAGEGWPAYGALEYSNFNAQRMAAISVAVAGTSNAQESSIFVTNLTSTMSAGTTVSYNPHTEGVSGKSADLEFSANGRYLFYTISHAPFLGVIDLQNNTVSELSDLVSIPTPENYKNGRMEMNNYQGVPSIFFITGSGLSVLRGCNNLATATFIPNAIAISPVAQNSFGSSPFNTMYLLPKQPFKHTQQAAQSLAVCCQNNIDEMAGLSYTQLAGTATWTYTGGNNPWGATAGPVYLSGDLIFNSGANITIQGMEFRFGPEADVVINRGAFVKLNLNSKWTSYECTGLMWPGVNLMGNPGSNQSATDAPNTLQGILHISSSTIENALIGVEVGVSNSTAGGVLKGYTATFLNCQNGVQYRPYSNIQHGIWYTSRWIINSQLKNPTISPVAMVKMTNMMGMINFHSCTFINDTPYQIYLMGNRGIGIDASNSRFSLNGGSGSYSGPSDNIHTTFYRWKMGIKVTNGGTTSFSVSSMHFQENNIGISASAVSNESITQNVFIIPSIAYIPTERPRGLILTGSTAFSFRGNDFMGISSVLSANTTAQNVGAMLVNCGGAENTGYRNDFMDLWKGQEVQGYNRNGDAMTGLQLRCNTYNNIRYDQYLASNAEWRHNQGEATDMTRLANNKFSLPIPNCGSLRYDVYVDPVHASTFSFDYIRPNNQSYSSNSQEPWDNVDCLSPFMVDFCPDLYANVPFVYDTHCPIGATLSEISGGIQDHNAALEELASAKALYQQVVDHNQKVDIAAEINSAFPMESDLMRNYLLARSPLSDQIMKEAIDKSGLLDPWHLTQVLLANGPLTKEVLKHLESTEVLNGFFMSFLYDAQVSGVANYRKLLENEISSREMERHDALIALLDYYNRHSEQVDNTQAIKDLMEIDGSIEAKTWLLNYYLEEGERLEAEALIEEIKTWKGMEDYAMIKTLQLSLNNDWTQANPTQLTEIELWAANPQSSAYGEAISVLHTLVLSDVLPEPELPFEARGAFGLNVAIPEVYVPELSAYPNPAVDRTFVTYPAEADGIGVLELIDGMGQLVASHPLNGNGIIDLETMKYASGVYLLSIVVDGKSIVTSKLIVTE